jgi:hypothetical protein
LPAPSTTLLGPRARKAWLAAHISLSIAWFGALAAFLVLDVATAGSRSEATLRAAYLGMHLVALWAILPLALGAFATGLVMALGTRWGLFRHYWVVLSLALTVFAILALSAQLPTLAVRADVAADPASDEDALRRLGDMVPRSVAALVLLATIIALSVFKPRGMTQYGWRRQLQAADDPDLR